MCAHFEARGVWIMKTHLATLLAQVFYIVRDSWIRQVKLVTEDSLLTLLRRWETDETWRKEALPFTALAPRQDSDADTHIWASFCSVEMQSRWVPPLSQHPGGSRRPCTLPSSSVSSSLLRSFFAISFFLIYFLLKDNCFTEFCCFLSNLNMNQP